MPLDYLSSIEHTTLPFTVTDEQAMECVRVLRAAGMVEAVDVKSKVSGHDVVTVIHAITDKGRVALAHYAQGKQFP